MELDVARAILNEAKSGGFMDEDIPASEEDIIKEAEYWLDEALKASEAGMQHETVEAIIRVSEPQGGGSEYNPGYASGVPPKSSGGFSESDLREGKVEIIEGTALGVGGPHPINVSFDEVEELEPKVYEEALKIAEQIRSDSEPVIIPSNLPIPKDFDDNLEDFPRDISELTDKDVRRLSGIYNSYLARAKWQLAVAISDLANSTHLRDHAYRMAIKKVEKVDPKTDKTKLKEVIDAETREDPEFAKWDEIVLGHQSEVTTLKALVEIYGGNVDRLSREWTMRQDEYEKTR